MSISLKRFDEVYGLMKIPQYMVFLVNKYTHAIVALKFYEGPLHKEANVIHLLVIISN